LLSNKKILVIRLSSLGDIILSFPLLKKLRKSFPDSEIHYLTKNIYEETVKLSTVPGKIILFNDNKKEVRKIIKDENYDLIIDIHKNFNSFYVSFNNAHEILRYKKDTFKKYLLVKFKINLFKEIIPVYKKYLNSVKNFLGDTNLDYEYDELRFSRDKIIDGEYFVISPASRHFTKTYPVKRFIEFINDNTDKKFVLVGDKSGNDEKICHEIEISCKNILNMCGKLNMKALANILYNSEAVICNDSAILHLSEAVGKKVMAVFGCTVKEFGFFPQLKNSKVIERYNLNCRPCTHIGLPACPKGHFECMNVELVK